MNTRLLRNSAEVKSEFGLERRVNDSLRGALVVARHGLDGSVGRLKCRDPWL